MFAVLAGCTPSGGGAQVGGHLAVPRLVSVVFGEEGFEDRRAVGAVEDRADVVVERADALGVPDAQFLTAPEVPELRAACAPPFECVPVELIGVVLVVHPVPLGRVRGAAPSGTAGVFAAADGDRVPPARVLRQVGDDPAVVGVAGEREAGDVGGAAVGPLGDVVDLAAVAGASHPGAVQPFSAPYSAIR